MHYGPIFQNVLYRRPGQNDLKIKILLKGWVLDIKN
jgi:hypothetical protein